MAYAKEEIESMATDLIRAGAAEKDVQDFIAAATQESDDDGLSGAGGSWEPAPTVTAGNTYFPHIDGKPIDVRDQAPLLRSLPGMVADAGMEGGGAALGQAAGAPFALVTGGASVPVGGAIGGALGNIGAQSRRILSGDQKTFSVGDFLASATGGAIPGGQGKGAVKLAVEGVKNVAGNVGGAAIQIGVDEKRLLGAEEAGISAIGGVLGTAAGKTLNSGRAAKALAGRMEEDSVENALIDQAKKAGYVLPPSKINPSAGNAVMDFLAGPSSVANAFSIRNQRTTDKLARQYIDLPEHTALSEERMRKAVFDAQAPYREIAALSPQAEGNLEGFMQARADARKYWRAYDQGDNPSPELKNLALQNDELADMFELEMKNEAAARGNADLMKRFDAARVKLAKINVVDQALGSDGHVSAKTFSRARDNGALLTDDAVTIAKTYETFRPVMRDSRDIGAIGSGKIPILDTVARNTMATGPYQSAMATPRYADPMPDIEANAARLSAMRFMQEDPETQTAKQNGAALYFLRRNSGG